MFGLPKEWVWISSSGHFLDQARQILVRSDLRRVNPGSSPDNPASTYLFYDVMTFRIVLKMKSLWSISLCVYILLWYSCSDKPWRHWERKTFLWASCGTGQVSLNHNCQLFDRIALPPSPGFLCMLCPSVYFDPKWFVIGKCFYSCSCASHCFKTTFFFFFKIQVSSEKWKGNFVSVQPKAGFYFAVWLVSQWW